jgi:hypothetical protein
MDHSALYINTNNFVLRHAGKLAEHPDNERLRALLLRCIAEEESIQWTHATNLWLKRGFVVLICVWKCLSH